MSYPTKEGEISYDGLYYYERNQRIFNEYTKNLLDKSMSIIITYFDQNPGKTRLELDFRQTNKSLRQDGKFDMYQYDKMYNNVRINIENRGFFTKIDGYSNLIVCIEDESCKCNIL